MVGKIEFDTKTISEIFKDLKIYLHSLQLIWLKIFPYWHKFGVYSIQKYHSHLNLHSNDFSLQASNHDVVLKLLEEINPSKAVGIDNIGGKFLKDGAPILAEPITKLCNLSIRLSTFPKKWKIAKLKPLYKKGPKLESKNYRPISLLLLVSKTFEKIIHVQTQSFLDENNILYKFQSGFRQNLSTNTSLSNLNDKILHGFDEGLFTEWFSLIYK